MNYLSKLMPYVRSGTTEGDSRFLADVFVSSDQLSDFCAVEPGSMRVLVGNKGTGKSAIVEWIHKSSTRQKIPSLLLRPDDLVDTGQPQSLDMSTLKAFYFEKLLRSVCALVGSQINSKTPLRGDAARLYNEARGKGLSREDFVTKSLELLSAIAIPAGSVNGKELAKELAGKNAASKLIGALNTQLLQQTSKLMYLLIDDTDQIARPNEPEQLNKIWALILAARKVAMLCNNVRPIVTLRSSVWARLIHENSAQRDQFDHIRPLVMALNTSDEHIQHIVEKRLVRASGDCFAQRERPYENFFENKEVLLPTSNQTRSWPDFIAKSSRERPRDALQLIKSMIETANNDHHSKIGDKDANKAMSLYSNERVDDVVAEYSLDCNAIKTIIDSFAFVPFEMPFERLREHLGKVPGSASIMLRGVALQPQSDSDAIKLLALLHEFGFINPRLPDSTAARKFKHLNYSEESSFVRESNWNNLQAARWEVHPAFRNHLIAVKDSKERQRLT
ncbi:P-loop ATPase, Sll1717 family [Lysobacter sp. F6437]|uniref:P-loop ATPase, Sll1717 family n=1 Tax=Lysobacter sp. F6437 TaxID=3459296 RepID=UPI00403D642C